MTASQTTVAVVCFDRREFEALQAILKQASSHEMPGSKSPLLRGCIEGIGVSVLRLPFGDRPQDLQRVLQQLITLEKPALLISLGTAMACHHRLAIGNLVINSKAFYGADSVLFVESLAAELLKAGRHGLPIIKGRSITSGTFINTPGDLEKCLKACPEADIVEMEDFHLGIIALSKGIPVVSLRAITDFGNFDEHMQVLPKVLPDLIGTLRRFLRQRYLHQMSTCIPNSSCSDLPFRIEVFAADQPLPVPEAVTIAKRVVKDFQLLNLLSPDARLSLNREIGPDFVTPPTSLSGKALLFEEAGMWRLSLDVERTFADITCTRAFFNTAKAAIPDFSSLLTGAVFVAVPIHVKAKDSGFMPFPTPIHIQGLNSISAEAEEGLLAASTIEEFAQADLIAVSSDEAHIWIYRTAHAADESYFLPDYPTPMRRTGPVPEGKYLIATGLGPVIDPTASGGNDADLLLLGDEQGGRLLQYLEDLGSAPFGSEDVFRYDGVAQRISRHEVALSRMDRRWVLTTTGLNRLVFEPDSLRAVYAKEYDSFLKSYFPSRRPTPALASWLFLTSRGCGNECSICCSGGFQPYTALEPETVVAFLKRLKDRYQPTQGQYLDIFLLDSNFNKIPLRIIRLVELLEQEGLLPFFEFYIRHNGLEGFLRQPGKPLASPNVHQELIQAYQRLGVDEIVIGIDSYTETSVRILKTSITRLRSDRDAASPSYTFSEIREVLTAIERHSLKSRCFLLMNNPFTGDTDRLETFYNLLHLSLEAPNFVIDYDSSTEVNDLKPFPGAPLTEIARKIPGLISGRKFANMATHGQIEGYLRFEPFRIRRSDPGKLSGFLASVQQVRFGVGDFLTAAVQKLVAAGSHEKPDLVGVAIKFLEEEARLKTLMPPFLRDIDFLSNVERQINEVTQNLRSHLDTLGVHPGHTLAKQTQNFYNLLNHLR